MSFPMEISVPIASAVLPYGNLFSHCLCCLSLWKSLFPLTLLSFPMKISVPIDFADSRVSCMKLHLWELVSYILYHYIFYGGIYNSTAVECILLWEGKFITTQNIAMMEYQCFFREAKYGSLYHFQIQYMHDTNILHYFYLVISVEPTWSINLHYNYAPQNNSLCKYSKFDFMGYNKWVLSLKSFKEIYRFRVTTVLAYLIIKSQWHE